MTEYNNMFYKGPERRQYKRIRKPFVAQFCPQDGDVNRGDSFSWDMVTLKNIGAGGLSFSHNSRIGEGTALDMKVNFPMAKEPIFCSGKVVRVEESALLDIFTMAVRFEHISSDDMQLINSAAENFFSRKTGGIEP